jgi:hypothetical protein
VPYLHCNYETKQKRVSNHFAQTTNTNVNILITICTGVRNVDRNVGGRRMNTSIFQEYRLLGCDAVWSDTNLSFRRCVLSPASWYIISILPKCRQISTRLYIQEETVLQSHDHEKSNFIQTILIESKYIKG